MPRLLPILVLLFAVGCAGGSEADLDFDADGWPDRSDCAPGDAAINPSASDDVGDAIDQNCDGLDGVDGDGDGFASAASGGPDCNDANADINPGATEVPDNAADEDCDQQVLRCDADGDLVFNDHPLCGGDDCDDTDGNCSSTADCDDADNDGQARCKGDCDDAEPTRFEGAAELCDGLDNDCNAEVPADESDVDGDGFRVCDGDCDDVEPATSPGADEVCNGLDDDCDGELPPPELDIDGSVGGFFGPGPTGPRSFGSADVLLHGAFPNDRAGSSVCAAGDLTGDGLGDLVVGAIGSIAPGSQNTAGRAFVVSGAEITASASPVDLASVSTVVVGESVDDRFGTSCAAGGDLDGDGLPDVLFGTVGDGAYLFTAQTPGGRDGDGVERRRSVPVRRGRPE